jgi:hypothetical protein
MLNDHPSSLRIWKVEGSQQSCWHWHASWRLQNGAAVAGMLLLALSALCIHAGLIRAETAEKHAAVDFFFTKIF